MSSTKRPYIRPSTRKGWFLTAAAPSSILLTIIGMLVWYWPVVVAGVVLFILYAILDKPYETEFDKEATLRMSKDLMGISNGEGEKDDSQNDEG